MQEPEVKQERLIRPHDFKKFLAKHQVFFLTYLVNERVLSQIDSKFRKYISITKSGTYALGEFIKAFSDELNRVPKGQNEVLPLLANAVMKAHQLQFSAVEVNQLVEKYPDLIKVIFNHQSTIEELSKEADGNVERFQEIMKDNNLFFELFCHWHIRGDRSSSRTVFTSKVRSIIRNSKLKDLLDFIKDQHQTNHTGYEAFQQVIRKPNQKNILELLVKGPAIIREILKHQGSFPEKADKLVTQLDLKTAQGLLGIKRMLPVEKNSGGEKMLRPQRREKRPPPRGFVDRKIYRIREGKEEELKGPESTEEKVLDEQSNAVMLHGSTLEAKVSNDGVKNTLFKTETRQNEQGHYVKSGATEDEIKILQDLDYLVNRKPTSDKCIVMKDLGQNLFDYVEGNDLEQQEIQLLALKITRHLQQLHNGQLGTTGYLHRDIHLKNIVRDSEGVVRLVDFGNGTALREDNKKLNERFLTIAVVPENLWRNPCSTIKTDIFLLGKTFKMLNSITEERFRFKAISTSMIGNMCKDQPDSRIDLNQVSATLKAQLPLKFQLNDGDINKLPKKITLVANTDQATVLDLDKKIEIRSYSRSLFSPVKISMRQYMKEMLNKDSKKAVAVYDAIITGNREELIEKLSEHRFINCFNTSTTTGMELYNNVQLI